MSHFTNHLQLEAVASPFSGNKRTMQLHPRRRALKCGSKWLREGFTYFTRNPGSWAIALLFVLVLFGLLALIPVAGAVSIVLLAPVFFGGLMFGCHQLWQQRNFHSRYLFAGFETQLVPLLKLGLLQLLWLLFAAVLGAAVFLLFGRIDFTALGAAGTGEELLAYLTSNPTTLIALITGVMLFLLGIICVVCGSWLSPALVLLGHARPMQAFRLSLWGCIKNTLPLLYFNVIVVLVSLLLLTPLMLLAWLIPSLTFGGALLAAVLLLQLLPVLVVANYSMARDIFPEITFYELPGITEVKPPRGSRGYTGFSN